MLEVQLVWVLLLGTLTLSLHGLIIDDWTTDRNHTLVIEIIAWVLTALLGIAAIIAFRMSQAFDGFIWAIFAGTAGAIALAANAMFDPVMIAVIWGILMIVVGSCGLYGISRVEAIDTRTFLYIMGVMLSLGGGVLFSVAHNMTLAAIGFLVALWVITIVFVFDTHANTVSRTPIVLSIIIATGLTIGVSVALLEHHAFIILLLGWIFQFIMWAGWVIITVN